MRILSTTFLFLLAISTAGQIARPKEQVVARASDYFREGKEALEQNRVGDARKKFDMAVDEILVSGFDVRADGQLNAFYLELVERIYHAEVPAPQQRLSLPLIASSQAQPSPSPPTIGFKEQKTDPSNDRLARPPAKPKDSDIVIQGFWLGMRLEDAEIPSDSPIDRKSVTDDDIKIGLKKYDLSRYDLRKRMLDISQTGALLVSLTFLDDVLEGISVGYDDTVSFSDINDFARAISRSLKLPAPWKVTVGKGPLQMATLNHNHFDFTLLFSDTTKSILVVSDTLDQTVLKRRRDEIERRRRQFKP